MSVHPVAAASDEIRNARSLVFPSFFLDFGFNSAHSEGHPHTEGTFTGTLVNVKNLLRKSGECQGSSREYGVVGRPISPKLARLRQSSHEGARMLLVRLGSCLI